MKIKIIKNAPHGKNEDDISYLIGREFETKIYNKDGAFIEIDEKEIFIYNNEYEILGMKEYYVKFCWAGEKNTFVFKEKTILEYEDWLKELFKKEWIITKDGIPVNLKTVSWIMPILKSEYEE